MGEAFKEHGRDLEEQPPLRVHRDSQDDADRLAAISKRLEDATFGFESPVEEEVDVIYINDTTIASLTNISLVLGLRKGGKSSFLSLVLGDRNGVIKTQLPQGKHLTIFADNEQSGKYLRVLQNRITKLNGARPEDIRFLKLREYSRGERLEIIKHCLDVTPEAGLLIIDNVKDICPDFNDPAEADKIVTTLIQWAQKFHVHIMCVLHLNKGNGLSRGHLGSELENKAETVIKIRKDDQAQAVFVEPEATRNKPFGPVSFVYHEDGTPTFCEGLAVSPASKSKSRKEPTDFETRIHSNLLDDVFQNSGTFKYEPLWRTIKAAALRYSITLGDNSAKQWLTHYKHVGMIVVQGKEYSRSSV